MKFRKPILVTGSHRSGSTWVGDIIACNSKVQYYHEPFNPALTKRENPIEYWFDYVQENDQKEARYANYLDSIVGINQDRVKVLLREYNSGKIKIRELLGMIVSPFKKRALVKDPIAFFSAPWFYDRYDADIVVLVRNPLAFIGSLKVKGWKFEFQQVLSQRKLMERHLKEFENEFKEYAGQEWHKLNIIEVGILQWNMIHKVLQDYMQTFPNWIFKKYEDLSLHPLEEFQDIFRSLKLDFEESVSRKLLKSTSGNTISELSRNSRQNISSWQRRLTTKEVDTILSKTEKVGKTLYPELYVA